MRKKEIQEEKTGFTLIEVMLTLAISGLIFVGLVSGLTGMVARQRYNRDVDEFAEFLRLVYSEAANPQGTTEDGGNNLSRAMYGRLVVIGTDTTAENGQFINDYLVTGAADVEHASGNYTLEALGGTLDLRIEADTVDSFKSSSAYTYIASPGSNDNNKRAQVAILIMRNLSGGSLRTYVAKCTTSGGNSGQCFVKNTDTVKIDSGDSSETYASVGSDGSVDLPLGKFEEQEVDFCVVSEDSRWAGGTRDVRLKANGANSSAVEIVAQDGGDNQCGSF